jgi:hypothetical protein
MYRDKGRTLEIGAVVLIRVERALPLISPAYDRSETEGQVRVWDLRHSFFNFLPQLAPIAPHRSLLGP